MEFSHICDVLKIDFLWNERGVYVGLEICIFLTNKKTRPRCKCVKRLAWTEHIVPYLLHRQDFVGIILLGAFRIQNLSSI